MAVHAYSRMDFYRLGIATMTVAVTAGASAAISFTATTTYRLFHGDATHNTDDGTTPANEGTDCLGVVLAALLNAAGLGGTWTVTWDAANGYYTIARDSGTFTLTFSGTAGTLMRRVLGHSGNRSAAGSIQSNQAVWYWFPFPGAESDDEARQPRDEVPRAYVQVTGGKAYGLRPYTMAYGRARKQEYVTAARATNKVGGAEAWTLERLFEHHADCERILWFDSTVTTFSYANREAVYQLSQEGVNGWRRLPVQPNWHAYFAVPLDLIEHTAAA